MRILRTIWGLYTFVVLAIVVLTTALFIWTTVLLFRKKAYNLNLFYSQKIGCNLICLFSFIFIRIKGREHFKKGEGNVIIGNHNSNYDIFVNSTTLPWHSVFCFLSKAELGKVPAFGIIAKNLTVLVDRSSMTSRMKSMIRMKDILKSGKSVWIFPEGTRNKTNEPLLDFQDGAFRLAVEMKSPIIVNTLVGIKNINNPNHAIDMAPGIVYSYFEAPISTENMTNADIPALKETVRNMMLARLNNA
jgi:1-acyl-sn-glycerol-3-phosphate acyltransferase